MQPLATSQHTSLRILIALALVVSVAGLALPAHAHAADQSLFSHLSSSLGVDAIAEAWNTVFGKAATLQGLAQIGALADTSLYVRPTNVVVEEGETVELEVRIKPGAYDELTAVSLDMTFDPELVIIESIEIDGSPFTTTLLAPVVDNEVGDASVTTGVAAANPPRPVTSDVLVATVLLRAQADVDGSPIAFTEASVAAAAGQSQNVIGTRTPDSVVQRTYGYNSDGGNSESNPSSSGTASNNAGETESVIPATCPGSGELVQFVNLLLVSGFIPIEKAASACSSLTSLESNQSTGQSLGVERFERSLTLGDEHPEVFALQRFLNAQGHTVAASGAGSPGNETSYFGSRTLQAVKSFQAAHAADILAPVGLSVPSGYWGPSSMKKANILLGS